MGRPAHGPGGRTPAGLRVTAPFLCATGRRAGPYGPLPRSERPCPAGGPGPTVATGLRFRGPSASRASEAVVVEDHDPLRTRTGDAQGATSVALEGELDIATAPLLIDAVVRALAARRPRLDLDVAALTFCDAAGVHALLQARRICRVHCAGFRLVGVRPGLGRILVLLRLTDLLTSPAEPVGSGAGAGSPDPLHASSPPSRLPFPARLPLPKESMS
ncbi:STAS domain-containing protein [Kitasatospora aureofaciens]